jgi:hypothetical protein
MDWLVAFVLISLVPDDPYLAPVKQWLGNDRALHGQAYSVNFLDAQGQSHSVPFPRHDMVQVLRSLANFMQLHAELVAEEAVRWDDLALDACFG